MNRRDFLKHTGAMSTASLLRQASVGTNAVALAGEMPESATPKTEDEGALCQRLEFSRNWRFFKGEANAAFQHLMLDEVRPEQGQNNWSFGVSRRAEGPREELMTLQQDYRSWGFMSAWEFSANPGCLINDGRFIPDNFPPHPYGLNLHCGEEGPWIPRVEWVSAREATADITIRGKARACTQVGDIRARILHNGRTVWESSDLKPYAQGESFNVQVSGVAKGDVLTFTQSKWTASAVLRLSHVTIAESATTGREAHKPSFDDTAWDTVSLPHAVATTLLLPALDDYDYKYEGVLWYRKRFNAPESLRNKKVFLELEAGGITTEIWLNGKALPLNGTSEVIHYGSCLPVITDMTDHLRFGMDENVVAVRIDANTRTDVPGDGSPGLHRDAWLHVTDKLHVTDPVYSGGGGVRVTYPFVATERAQVQVKTHVLNEYQTSKSVTLRTSILDAEGRKVAEQSDVSMIEAGAAHSFDQILTVEGPRLWHPNHPNLYTVLSEVHDGAQLVDKHLTRIGIRSVEFTRKEGFKINGEYLRFRGINHTDEAAYVGRAVTKSWHRRDAILIKEAGFQYARCSNGPRDTSLLDAFDELGVMVLAGLPGSFLWGGPRFAQNSYQNARDLLRRDRNHPCIIAWELSINECWWPDEQFSPTMVRIGHDELPGSYIGGFKDHGGWGGPCWYDINITGPGNDHEKYDGPLPTIRHEYGHFPYGGVHSTSDVNRGDGEARMLEQATNHQHETNMLFSLPVSAYVGAGVFCYGDYASYPSGMVDKLRIPKFSYFFWKSQRDPSLNFGSLGIESGPMVFIANYWTLDSPQDVRVYSNCDEVKLYLNGKYLQSRTPDCEETSETPFRAAFKNTAVWHPPFTFAGVSKETGTLRADGYIKGEKSASHSVTTPGKPVRLAVRIETKGIGKAVTGVHVLPVYVALEDAADSVVPWGDRNKDKVLVQFECSGEAVIVGARTVRLEAGVAGTILKTTGEVGPVSVQATVDSGADGRRFKGTGTATLEVSKL